MKSLLFFSIIVTFLACKPQVEAEALSFLDSTWVVMAGRPVERWTFHQGRLEGEGLIINEGDTTVFERIRFNKLQSQLA